MSTTTERAPDHVAGFAYLGTGKARAHLIQHGRRLDLIGPLTRPQMNTLHAMLHAGPPEGCEELNVVELPSPAWCRVCRQRGYASAHCAAVAARNERPL